jgi:putative YhdH/YhfP family quinone oxidoreductase
MIEKFKALLIEENSEGKISKSIQNLDFSFLKKNEVTIKVEYSSLNYKDALSASGNKGITRNYPHIPGIDAAGKVVESCSDNFKIGDEVVVTGRDLGMNTFGGFSEYISAPADWVIKKPNGLSLIETMMYGTAGFTAASGIFEIQKGEIEPGSKVLVSGATGAVGSIAVSILSKLGYHVIASTGKASETDFLKSIGASEVIDRKELDDNSPKPLLSKRWAAAFDTVGGSALSYILKSTADRGVVTNCGMIVSPKLETSIMPFILRAVKLIGIASAETPMPRRLEIWDKLSGEYKLNFDENRFEIVGLEELPDRIDSMLKGELKRKVLVKI